MKAIAGLALVLSMGVALAAQERRVPSDSARITLSGCARKSLFVVRWPDGHEPVTTEVAEGRRFRLTGQKDVLGEVRKHEGSMVELTGLVRKDALQPRNGVSVGRVRIGVGSPQAAISDPARSPEFYQPVFDVESYLLLPEPCPSK